MSEQWTCINCGGENAHKTWCPLATPPASERDDSVTRAYADGVARGMEYATPHASETVEAALEALPRRLRIHAGDVRKDHWLYVADEIEAAADEIERLRDREAAIRAEADERVAALRGVEWDAEHRWLVHTDDGGASAIVAHAVLPWFGEAVARAALDAAPEDAEA